MIAVEYQVYRGGVALASVKGADRHDRRFLSLDENADVIAGDELVSVLTEERITIEHVEKEVSFGAVMGLKAHYVNAQEVRRRADEERRASQAAAPTFNVGPNYGIVGTQAYAQQTQTFDMRSMDLEIERRGEDVEELRELVRELQGLLAQGVAPRGALLRFSELLEKHSWITGSLAGAVIGHLTK